MKVSGPHDTQSLFQLIDFDRTLFDTARFVAVVTEEIDRREPGFGASLRERFEAAYADGRTFFLFRQLRQEKGDRWVEALVANVVEAYGAESFLMPGARKRLEQAGVLDSGAPAWGIMTYGDDVDQYMKLRIAGLEHALVYITHTPRKGGIIKDWALATGGFALPEALGGAIVDTLSLEDDKLTAFYGMPAGVLGVWVTEDPHANELLANENLGYVRPVRSLHESAEVLRGRA